MTRTLVAAFALALSTTSALSQDYNRESLVRGLCQKDGCDEFTILAADRVKTTDEGTLFKTRLKTFHASYTGRQDRGEENGYVYCSPTRPSIMAEQNGQTMAFFLAPFATQESRERVRQNANFHALYFTICHGREAGKAAVHNLAGVAQSHGYRVALSQSKLLPLKRAEDVIAMAGDSSERAPDEASRGERSESRPDAARLDERRDRPPVEARREERVHPMPAEAMRRERPVDRQASRQASSRVVEREDEGLLSGARRLTNRAFDALDEMGNWVLGEGR
jgi:hypothetical protein